MQEKRNHPPPAGFLKVGNLIATPKLKKNDDGSWSLASPEIIRQMQEEAKEPSDKE